MKQKYFYFLLYTFFSFFSFSQTATHLNFDGVNDYVELTTQSNFSFFDTNQMTVEFRMQSNNTPDQWDALVAKGDSAWRVSLTSTGTVAFSGTGAFVDIFSITSVTDGNWHHIAATYNGTNAYLYIDGILEASVTATGSINISTYPVTLGENAQATGRYYNGNLDELRIWNISRSSVEINDYINTELQGNEQGLLAYYKFNQGFAHGNNSSENTLLDLTTNNNYGLLYNFALSGSTSNWISGSIPNVSNLATHLNFDGLDDRVSIPYNSAFNFTTGVVEAWVNIEANSDNKSVVSLRENANSSETRWSLYVNEGNDRIGIFNGTTYSSISYTLNPNTWYHIAWKMNSTRTFIFVNGVLQGFVFTTINDVPINVPLTIGAPSSNGTNLNEYFKGNIDDVRIWNDLTSSIYNCELKGNESNLVAYYKFNQGEASGLNTSETMVFDATTNGFNGTLNNFALSSSASNWLGGSPMQSMEKPTVNSPINYMYGESASQLTATLTGSGWLWYTSETGGTGSTTAPTPDTTISGVTSYWVSSTYNGGCESARSKIDVNVAYLATHLNFDGVNDYVQLPNESNFDFTNQMTVEFWMNSNVLPQQWDALVVKGDDSWRVSMSPAGEIAFTGSGAFTDFFSTTSVTDGDWHHIAATYDGANAKIYIDGVLESQLAGTANINNSGYNVTIGENLQMTGRHYNGNIDEVRIWNVARTATQINASKNCELQGNELGLVAYYQFNQGQDPADNSGITSLIDKTANSNNGALNNFALNSSTSNWLSGSPVISGSIIPNSPIVSPNVVYNLGDTALPLTANIGANGTGLLWFTSSNGSSGVTTAPTPSITIAGNTSYWVSTTNSNGCESERVEIIVSVTSNVSTPQTNWLTQIFTGDDKTLSELQVTGTAIQWYDAATGGNLLPISTILIDDTTYFATQTISGIESNTRLPIVVNRILDNSQTINSTGTINDIVTTPSIGSGVQWFTTPTGGVALQTSDILSTGTYYVEQNSLGYVETVFSEIDPVGIDIQADGKIVYSKFNFSDSQVRRIDADGSNLETLGSGFLMPRGIAIQPDNKIIVADVFNNAVKIMNPDGTNILQLGGGFSIPHGVALQTDGKIIVADYNNNAIKRMDADGSNIINLGSGFSYPSDVAVQSDGNIIVVDQNGIKRMYADGSNIETLITGSFGGIAIQIDDKIVFSDRSSDDIKRMNADGTNIITLATGFNDPQQMAIQLDGRIVIADYDNHSIKRIVAPSNRVPVVITSILNSQIYTGDDKTIADIQMTGNNIQWYNSPSGGSLLPDSTSLTDETIYYASQTINGNESSVRLDVTVNRISDNSQTFNYPAIVDDLVSDPIPNTFASWFETETSSSPIATGTPLTNGIYYVSQVTHGFTTEILGTGFTNPFDTAVQQDGKILVADTQNNVVKRMDADGANIETLASFVYPIGVAIQSDGKIIVSSNDNTIKRMNSDGSNIEILLEPDTSTYPVQYVRSYGIAMQVDGKILFTDNFTHSVKRMNLDGSNIEILGGGFNNPRGVAVQADGKIIIADTGNNTIKRMDADGSNIVTLGTGFNAPHKAEVQPDGKIIISDTGNGAIKRMNADGTNIEILSDGFNSPLGIAIEANGNIVLADFNNNQVKRIIQFNQSESNRVPVQIIQDCNSTTWNGVSWSNGTPDSNKAAIFNSNYTINADIHVCKLEVNNNANVTLSSGVTLTVNNEIVVASNGNFTVENDAVILQNNPYAINTGNVVVKRNSVPMIRLDYTAWGSPVTDQNLLSFSPNTLTNRFYTYDSSGTNTATSWVSIDPSNNNFSVGVGYLIRVANNWSSVTPASYLGTFNGVPNNGTIANPVGIGYNLIGNPYPSPINADLFLTDNSSLGINTLYFWTHVVPQNGSYTAQSNYASYNTVGGVAASAGGVIPDGVIQVGQGFFHNASTIGNVLFNNNQRRGTSNGQFFKSSQSNIIERHRIWLSLKDDSTEYNQFLVAYMDGATNGLDALYDGKLLTNATSTLSSIINNEDYVIQAKAFPFNNNDEVELNFVASNDSNYTISLDNFDGLFINQDIFLWDKTLNIYHDIKQSSYTFNTLAGTYDDRFSIVYNNASLSIEEFEDQEQVSIFMNNSNQIVIKNYNGLIDNVEVFDLTGRLLYAKMNWGNPELVLENNFSTNVLLVRTKTTLNKITTRKLIIK